MKKVLTIGLDGFCFPFAEKLMAAGEMPALKQLKSRSARFRLRHGIEKYAGIAWEQFCTGKTSAQMGRYSAIEFDPDTYHVDQVLAESTPEFANFQSRCLLLDMPYCNIGNAPNVQGFWGWGAHDAGGGPLSQPASLLDEIEQRFGAYPAPETIYGLTWMCPDRTAAAGEAMVRCVDTRTDMCRWLLTERLPDWDLAVVVPSEAHSVVEAQWHGIDPTHPLAALPSAAPAEHAMRTVYHALDRLIGTLVEATPDAAHIVFAPHGMGPNSSDTAGMALLGELMYRDKFGEPYMAEGKYPGFVGDNPLLPSMRPPARWEPKMVEVVPRVDSETVAKALAAREGCEAAVVRPARIDYQPVARYRVFWPVMDAFALPSFTDGRIRLNLKGRERYGRVAPEDRDAVIERVKAMLLECTNPRTGQPIVAGFHELEKPALELGPTEPDLFVHFHGVPNVIDHPRLGRMGPIPLRRSGGHTGGAGAFWAANFGFAAGDHGAASTFDVLPTLADAVGDLERLGIHTGTSLLRSQRNALQDWQNSEELTVEA